jgi:CRISPR-associated protein Csb1
MERLMEDMSGEPRLLIEADLRPVQGQRFQPTGFPDLGPAEFLAPDGKTQMLLVESCQSMANRMEEVCWNWETDELIAPLAGLPYIEVDLGDGSYTNSVLEAHRINSEYIAGNQKAGAFNDQLRSEIDYDEKKPVEMRKLYSALLKYDVNSLIHGVFLEEIGGRLRIPRALSAFIEAENIRPVQSGGVKFSRVDPKEKGGRGNVPFPRTEYTAESIKAYFNLDLSLIRGFCLPKEAEELLISLSLYKVQRFMRDGLRLRTACDLECPNGPEVTRPEGITIPADEEIEPYLRQRIEACAGMGCFVSPSITTISFKD